MSTTTSSPLLPQELTVKQCAAALSIHPKTVRRYIKHGRLHWRFVQGKFGREYRISRESIEHLSIPLLPTPQPNLDSEAYNANTEAIRKLTEKLDTLVHGLLPAAQREQDLSERVNSLEQNLTEERKEREQLQEELQRHRGMSWWRRIWPAMQTGGNQ